MSYRGDIRLGDTIHIKFSTVGTTGAPTTLANTPSISVYPGSSATQLGPATVATPASGITFNVDFDAVTGFHNVTIVASSGNGYATATNYEVMLSAGTVGGTSVVGYVVGSFSIENRSALMPTTAGRTLVVDAAGLADANTVKLGPTGAGTAQTAKDVGGAVPAVAAGAANGLLISGSNSGTTTLGALTVTGATTLTGAVSLGSTLGVTGLTTLAGLTTGALSATTITASGLTSLAAVTASGTLTLAAVTQVGAVSLGATTIASAAITGALSVGTTTTFTGNVTMSGAAGLAVTNGITANITGNLVGTVSTLTTYTGNTPQTGDSFARIGAAGAGLTAVVAASVTGNVGGNVVGSVASIAANGITAGSFAANAIDAAALATTAVDEIRDGVWAKTQAELTGDPGATPTVLQAQMLEYMAIRNKRDTDSGLGTDEIHNSAGTVILTATISDAAGIFSKAKYA